jgi:hypothetical protein
MRWSAAWKPSSHSTFNGRAPARRRRQHHHQSPPSVPRAVPIRGLSAGRRHSPGRVHILQRRPDQRRGDASSVKHPARHNQRHADRTASAASPESAPNAPATDSTRAVVFSSLPTDWAGTFRSGFNVSARRCFDFSFVSQPPLPFPRLMSDPQSVRVFSGLSRFPGLICGRVRGGGPGALV